MDKQETLSWLRAKLVDINKDRKMIESSIKHLEKGSISSGRSVRSERAMSEICTKCGHHEFHHWWGKKDDCSECGCKEFTLPGRKT